MAAHSSAAPCPRCSTLTTCVSDDENATTVSGSCPTCGLGMTLALIPNSPHGVGAPGVKPGFHQGMVTSEPVTAVDPELVDESASHGGVVEFGSQTLLAAEPQDSLRADPSPGSYGVPLDAASANAPVDTEPTPSGAHPDSEAAFSDAPAWTPVESSAYVPEPGARVDTPASLGTSDLHDAGTDGR